MSGTLARRRDARAQLKDLQESLCPDAAVHPASADDLEIEPDGEKQRAALIDRSSIIVAFIVGDGVSLHTTDTDRV